MDAKEAIALMLAEETPQYVENPYWDFLDGEIVHRNGHEVVDIDDFRDVLDAAARYFRHVFDAEQTEAQVLVLDRENYGRIAHLGLPTITTLTKTIVVLPQRNTWGTTQVSDEYWYRYIDSLGVTPYMRIHSHHTLNAYQSNTDYNTLNSGSLEVVLGKIYDQDYQVAYWLDQRGRDTKSNVFRYVNGRRIVGNLESNPSPDWVTRTIS